MIERRIQRVGASPGDDEGPPLTIDDLVAAPCSGLLVAEGGMGKSTFLEALAVRLGSQATLIKLAYFALDPQRFVSQIDRLAEAAPGTVLFLDGLDEAVPLARTVSWCVERLPDTVQVWVASRACQQLVTVGAVLAKRKAPRYRLLPFSKDEIKERAKEEGLDAESVAKVLQAHDLWALCGNPLGCAFVLKAIKRNQQGGEWTSREIWSQGVRSLCDETPSETKPLDPDAGRFSVGQIYECAAWIALNLSLSGKNAVFHGVREVDCPPSAVTVSALTDDGNRSRKLIETALLRGAFAPWAGDCVGFAHAMYSDYLAAEGFRRHVPRDQWESLLLDPENRCLYAQRTGVAQWLMTTDADLADRVFELSPESLLTYDLARLKMDGLCQTLLAHAEAAQALLGWGGAGALMVLQAPATYETLRLFFLNAACNGSYWSTDLAIDIAGACEYWDLLVVFVLDDAQDVARRQDAVYALSRCPDIEIKKRLRPLLGLLADKSDRWRGALLSACWPDVLSVEEVMPYLAWPQDSFSAASSGYRAFLGYQFFGPLLERLDPSTCTSVLVWANGWLAESLGGITADAIQAGVRAVYTRYWNHAAPAPTDARVALLADGYLAASQRHRTPFLAPDGRDSSAAAWRRHDFPQSCVLSHEVFVQQRELRFAVLCEIVKRRPSSSSSGFILWLDCALLQDDEDRVRAAEKLLAAPFAEEAEGWSKLLRYSWGQRFLEQQGDLVDRLHVARPDLFPETCWELLAAREAGRKELELVEGESRAAIEEEAAKCAAWQQQVDRDIKEALSTDGTPTGQFAGLSAHLYADNGSFRGWEQLDLRQTVGWSKLTEVERERMLRFAERFLLEAPQPEDGEQGLDLTWHRALYTLKVGVRERYESLPEAVWRNAAPALLRYGEGSAPELYDELARRFPTVAAEALIRCLRYERGVSALRAWGERLTAAQAEAVWDSRFSMEVIGDAETLPVRCFPEFPCIGRVTNSPVCNDILACLARYQPDVVRRRMNEWLKDGFAVHLGHPFYDVLRRFALQLEPDHYFTAFLQTLGENADWGRRWLEANVFHLRWSDSGGSLSGIVFSRAAEDIGILYSWIDSQYPQEEDPNSGSRADSVVSAVSRVYDLKTLLFSDLVKTGKRGSARVVEKLFANKPDGFKGHVATARRNEAAARLPTLTVEEVRELANSKKAVIASAGDLRREVLSLLTDYQARLKGKTPAVEDLWDSAVTSPKKEEAFSGHLERFLRDRLPGSTFVNREVQISRKLAEDGEAGTRTDIWIDCETVCQNKVSLCIEVKCSWNRDAKTAIAGQLIGKYMSPGRADAGILLLAWFHCAAWKTGGRAVWASPEEARADLERQVEAAKIGKPLAVFVLDCTL
jgi:hypothetical protein